MPPLETDDDADDDPLVPWLVIAFIVFVVAVEVAVACLWIWSLAGM